MTCPPICSLPVSATRSAPPHSSSAWGVEKCADIKTRGFATVQTQWHNRSGRWSGGGVAPKAAVRPPICMPSPPLSRHVSLPHGKSGYSGPGHSHQEGGHHQRGGHAGRFVWHIMWQPAQDINIIKRHHSFAIFSFLRCFVYFANLWQVRSELIFISASVTFMSTHIWIWLLWVEHRTLAYNANFLG